MPPRSSQGAFASRYFWVGCCLLGVAVLLAVAAFFLGQLTQDQRFILLWILPIASGIASGAFAGSASAKAQGLIPGAVISVTGGFVVWLFTYYVLPKPEVEPPHSSLPSTKAVVLFYKSIQTKDYQTAWDVIAPDSGIKKKVTLAQFSDGYRYTVGINNLSVTLEKEASDSVHEFLVYYLDVIDCPLFEELRNLHKLNVSELPDIQQRLTSLRDRVVAAGFDGKTIDELNFHQILAPNSGDKLRWLLSRDAADKDATELYGGRTEAIAVLRGYRVFAQKYDDGWHIRKFQELQAGPI